MKLAGLLLLFAACGCYGIMYAANERRRFSVVCEVERLVRYMMHQIEHYRRDIWQIYLSFESEILDCCGFSQGLGESWEKAVERVECPNQVKDALISFGRGIGMKDSGEQIECCRRCLEVLEEYTSKEKKNIESRVKIYVCLGITVGAVILIMGL